MTIDGDDSDNDGDDAGGGDDGDGETHDSFVVSVWYMRQRAVSLGGGRSGCM